MPEEADLEVQIYEADSATDVLSYRTSRDGGDFKNCANPPTRYCSGGGQYDFNRKGDFIEWEITVSSAGTYKVSFRYSNGGDYNDGNRPLVLLVNNEVVVQSYDFFFTESSNYYRYSDLVDVALNAGTNTLKLSLEETQAGPNIGT